VVIAVVAALAMFGVVLVTVAQTIEQADAARPVGAGCPGTVPGANASKTRCFNG
jgi:hypothetical protein